ncbi:fibronectin type III domain-containing protein [Geoanaerobacter pelophilus]|uniref:Fibronectin type III domain-containing protein n=1 Tax=Geoanaerobacter pelophilus TaxID=60036 RepID=A0ABQ0MG10_9BACT|nr:hypothetical protein [Geoanaerobacter pelophilus]GAW65849.1 fibronectin type III domain-containing protein [Geoanaerobacter pelophilus]
MSISTLPELLDLNLNGYSINDFIVFVNTMADKTETHPALKEYPEYFTSPEKLREKAALLGQLRDASANGDREKKAEKMAAWEETKLAVIMNGKHITMLSLHRKDPSILLNTGFNLKQKHSGKPTSTSSTDLLAETPGLALRYVQSGSGPIAGAFTVIITKAKNRANTELQMSDNPSDEFSWKSQGIYAKARIEYKGQQSEKRLYFRARYHQEGGVSPWSQAVNILVL